MAITIWPVDAKSGAPQYAGRGLRQTTVGVPLAGATSARPLGVRSGVRPGTPATTVAVSGATVTVRPHAGVLDVQAAVEASGYEYSSDANTVVSSTFAQDQSNPRADIVWVQVTDPAEGNGGTPSVVFGYTAGAAAGAPTTPALPARAMLLAVLNVPKVGGGNATVTWSAPTLVAAGGVVPVRSVAELKALVGYPGAYADLSANVDDTTYLLGLYRSDGTNWTPVGQLDDTGWVTPTFAGGSTASPSVQFRRRSGIVYFTGLRNPTADDQVQFTLPVGFRPLNQSIFWCDRSVNTGPGARVDIRNNGQVIYRQSNVTGGTGAVNYAPVTFPADA